MLKYSRYFEIPNEKMLRGGIFRILPDHLQQEYLQKPGPADGKSHFGQACGRGPNPDKQHPYLHSARDLRAEGARGPLGMSTARVPIRSQLKNLSRTSKSLRQTWQQSRHVLQANKRCNDQPAITSQIGAVGRHEWTAGRADLRRQADSSGATSRDSRLREIAAMKRVKPAGLRAQQERVSFPETPAAPKQSRRTGRKTCFNPNAVPRHEGTKVIDHRWN
jgi:hypothetical protein